MNRIPDLRIPLKGWPPIPGGAIRSTLLALAMTAGLIGCAPSGVATPPVSTTINKSEQSAITPDAALARLKDGNRRFVSGDSLRRDYPAQVKATAAGQYPFAAVLSCMDSRSSPEIVFDQGIGDLFVVRVAGNYAPADIMGSLEYATKVAGAKLVVVMGHTECGAIKGACDDVKLGNLTTVIQALQPAIEDVKDFQGDRTSKNKKFVLLVTEANVRRTVAKLRTDSPILRELEQTGQIKIVGAIHDISTGQVTFFDWNGGGG
ncbi:MAG: carbonic anhydrase family protein [Tepidisphaeraceae bacterium]